MKNVEQIEYHTSCPACGAINNGSKFCEYCGSSMIKTKTISSLDNNAEADLYESEDMNLPMITGKSVNNDLFMTIFCLIFGGVFFIVPTFLCIIFATVGILEIWLIPFFSIFWIVGLGTLIPLIVKKVNKAKCKNGPSLKGVVRGYEPGLVMVNNRPVLNVKLKVYVDGQYKLLKLSTGSPSKKYPLGKELTLRYYNKYYMIEE